MKAEAKLEQLERRAPKRRRQVPLMIVEAQLDKDGNLTAESRATLEMADSQLRAAGYDPNKDGVRFVVVERAYRH